MLDVACGTGDLTLAFTGAGARPVIGIDFTYDMLSVARRKGRAGRSMPAYVCADASALPLADACAEVVSIAFGVRNLADPTAAIRQFHRVLRPGGRLVILEFSTPVRTWLRRLYQFYFRSILPRTATMIAGDRSGAYRYLPRSVDTFLNRDQIMGLVAEAGFTRTALESLTFGVAVIYSGVKPAAPDQPRP